MHNYIGYNHMHNYTAQGVALGWVMLPFQGGQWEHWAIYFKYLTDKSKRKKINKIIELDEGIAMASRKTR